MNDERDTPRAGGDGPELVRHEEELVAGAEQQVAGHIRARKRVESERVERVEDRAVEYGEVERTSPHERDSGEIETLEDGSVSIPLFEERLVVTKELVVRERVIVRKRTVSERHRIDAELRKERIDIDVDDAIADDVEPLDRDTEPSPSTAGGRGSTAGPERQGGDG